MTWVIAYTFIKFHTFSVIYLGVKFKSYCDKLEKEIEDADGKVSSLYLHHVSKLKESLSEHHCEFSNDIEEKIVGDKDDLLRHIERCRNGFIFHLQDTEN